jgi:predicted permease
MVPFLRRFRARIKYWNNAEELKKELDAHREMAAASFAADGTSERESRWKAARLLGNATLAREDARAVWVARWIDEAFQDGRYALRSMRREWGFAATASITLAIGIGAIVTVFTAFNTLFWKTWPVRSPQEVFGLTTSVRGKLPDDGFGPAARISHAALAAIAPVMTSADLVAKVDYTDRMRATADGPWKPVRIGLVSDRFIDTIGIPLQSGGLAPGTGEPGLVISDAVWRTLFAGSHDVLGRRAWIGTRPVVVTGVFSPVFLGFSPRVYDGLMLVGQTADWLKTPDLLTNPKQCCVEILGRLRPGFNRAVAGEEISRRANAFNAALGLPEISVETWDTTNASRPGFRASAAPLIALLFAGCGVITLLASVNIGNLQLARGMRRSREIAVRLSLGAGRRRVVRQLFSESAALSLVGAAGGLWIAWIATPLLMRGGGPSSDVFTPDLRVVLFAAATALATTCIFGLVPALKVTKIDWRSAAGNQPPRSGRLRHAILAVQIALSVGLIASATLLSRATLRAASGADAGFDFRNVNAMYLAVTESDKDPSIDTLKRVIRGMPNLALTDLAPFGERAASTLASIPGGTDTIETHVASFNQSALKLLKIPLVAGRWYSDDRWLHETAISKSLAQRLWGTEDVIGRTFVTGKMKDQYTVVGVIADIRLEAAPIPVMVTAWRGDYLPVVLARPEYEKDLKALVAGVAPTIRVVSRPMISGLGRRLQEEFVGMSIASGLGVLALLLASLGVFGVFAYIVEERRREIGVRLALGASRAQIRGSIVAATRWPIVGGLAVGLLFALAGGVALRHSLFGLSILDPLSYLMSSAVLGTAAMAATYVPMRRATRVDPAITLRAD